MFVFCLLLDPKFHWKETCALGENRSCSAAQQAPAFSGCGQDYWSQRHPCTRVQPAGTNLGIFHNYSLPKQSPSLGFIPQKTRVQNSTQIIVPVLLMPREKDGALQTARTDPNFIERKAVLEDCKCSFVSRIFTHSVRYHLVFRMAQNAGHTGFQNTCVTFIVWHLLGPYLKASVLVHSCQK